MGNYIGEDYKGLSLGILGVSTTATAALIPCLRCIGPAGKR